MNNLNKLIMELLFLYHKRADKVIRSLFHFHKLLFIWILLPAFFFFSCQQEHKTSKDMALNLENLDTTVSPTINFYQYANGGWMKYHPLPSDKSRYGTFDELQEENNKRLQDLILDISSHSQEKGSVSRKINDFYDSGMDTATIEETGLKPLQEEINNINHISGPQDVIKEIARLQASGIHVLFNFYGNLDPKNSKIVIAHLGQGGLGMTDRDYYINKDARSKEMRQAYLSYIAKMFVLMGDNNKTASGNARKIMNLETGLAQASMTRLERRDPLKTYHKMNYTELQKNSPAMEWPLFFKGINLPAPGEINVTQPGFFKETDQLLTTTSSDTWKAYLTWHLINSLAPYLGKDFVNTHFDFYGKVVQGTKEMEPRWKRVIYATNNAMGEALGKMFVKKYFPPKDKDRMTTLVGNLKKAFANRIKKVEWMSEQTKKNAIEKLAAMNLKIGYPDQWRDYSKLVIKKGVYVSNVMRASTFNFNYMKSKIGKPRDPNEWLMTPQTVNAYNSPTRNEICFPAGILQPPFFYPKADDAVNYGAIGVVIGHEMTHGFDDKGRLYDKDGNLNNWWTDEDAKKFRERTNVLVKQFDSFVVRDTIHANGKLTLGENLADLGGLNISYDAFKTAIKGKKIAPINGFTPDQRFYLAYAHVWAQNIRGKEILRRTQEDVHSLGKFRVNGPVRNLEPFLKAFNIKPGDPMYLPPEKRAIIW